MLSEIIVENNSGTNFVKLSQNIQLEIVSLVLFKAKFRCRTFEMMLCCCRYESIKLDREEFVS